jgi:ABC-type branched-subunit amino acid transport system ATPase component
VLSTRNLNKSFGSLVVANDINLALPKGVRYALIGPNGAGKTTLINLLTGMLQPDQGEIFLSNEKITALRPEARVRRGLARTFQINTLFPRLTALESVTLAVLEREGHAHNWWRSLPRFGGATDEALATLDSLNLAGDRDRLTHELPYGKQRLLEIALAIACQPRVLLLDEPAAGVPEEERHEILAAVASLPRDVTVLIIEHDMDIVFSFAERISVLVNGGLFVEGTPDEVGHDPRVKAVYLGEEAADD